VTYRNDLEAALARNAALERELAVLKRAPARPSTVPEAARGDTATGEGIAAQLAALERSKRDGERRAQSKLDRQRAATAARLARRSPRVGVTTRSDGSTRVTVRRARFLDVWGLLLPSYVLLPAGLTAPILWVAWWWLAIPIVVTLVVTWFIGRAMRSDWHLDLTADGYFAVHRGDPRKAKLFGRRADLQVSLDTVRPWRLHDATFYSSHAEITKTVRIGDLIADDIVTLQRATTSGS